MLEPDSQFRGHLAAQLTVRIGLFVVCGLVIPGSQFGLKAQTLHARISVTSIAPARVRIDVEFPVARNDLSFRNAYAGILGLGERIEAVEAVTNTGATVVVNKLAAGEFQILEKFRRFRYEVNLSEQRRPSQLSHVSSLTPEHGLLMLADLLPPARVNVGDYTSALITVDVPVGWTVGSNAKRQGAQFSTDDPENAVFFIGPAVLETSHRLEANNLLIVSSGKWPFSNKDATRIAEKLITEYAKTTRFVLKHDAVLMLLPFPGGVGPESWSAETRGNNVVLLLGRNASRKRVLSRLGIVLTHEMFHLWVPNSLKLRGDYDWFYEGFTLYQALRMALQLRLISFDDYLVTMARVYDAYVATANRDRVSLIESSERRWTSSTSLVYGTGMLVAFIYDLSLRKLTNCGASLDDLYPKLFQSAETGQGSANEIIIKLLGEPRGLESFGREYVETAKKIELEATLSSYGIEVQQAGSGQTRLVPSKALSREQRDLLNCIRNRK